MSDISQSNNDDRELLELLRGFGLVGQGRREVAAALVENPEGLERIARLAAELGDNPAGLLVAMVRAGAHRRGGRLPDDGPMGPVTGWRWVRGTHSGTYVPDPNGRDRLPPGYGIGGG